MTKYLEERRLVGGRVKYAFNPSKGIRNALNLSYQAFPSKDEAIQYCQRVHLEFSLHRKMHGNAIALLEESVADLINFYKTTHEWLKLKENSQKHYNLCLKTATGLHLDKSKATFGTFKAKTVTATQADRLYTQIQKDYSDHRASHVIKVLRKVYNVSFRHDKVKANPFASMNIPELPCRTVLWTPEQVMKVIETADRLGYPSLGTITLLTYDLCARPGDMRQLQWDSYHNGMFTYTQEKTGTEMCVPASPRLIERLGTAKVGAIAVCETTGKPYSKDLLVKYFARVRRIATVPTHLQLRDLRRTGATEMAENGCTEDELRAVTGHQSREILATYVRPTTKLAMSAMNKRFG